jgi:serine/threonine protein kinase
MSNSGGGNMSMEELLKSIGMEKDTLYLPEDDTTEEYSCSCSNHNDEDSDCSHRRRRRSYSSDSLDGSEESEGDDRDSEEDSGSDSGEYSYEEMIFPYEENIFILNRTMTFSKRLALSDDVVVYKAQYRKTGKHVAIKIIRGDLDRTKNEDGSSTVTLPKEVRFVKNLQGHPCIVPYVCWLPLYDTDCYAIITEYVHKQPINILDLGVVKKYMSDVLGALKFMHEKKIIYRDVKPSNIIYDGEKAVIIDFDCSVLQRDGKQIISTIGTEGYMAPEIEEIERKKIDIRKNKKYSSQRKTKEMGKLKGYDHRVDIYSAGVTFGQLVFGIKGEYDVSRDVIIEAIEGFDENVSSTRKKFNNKIKRLKGRSSPNKDDLIEKTRKERNDFVLFAESIKTVHGLVEQMMSIDPDNRPTIDECFSHPFFQ